MTFPVLPFLLRLIWDPVRALDLSWLRSRIA